MRSNRSASLPQDFPAAISVDCTTILLSCAISRRKGGVNREKHELLPTNEGLPDNCRSHVATESLAESDLPKLGCVNTGRFSVVSVAVAAAQEREGSVTWRKANFALGCACGNFRFSVEGLDDSSEVSIRISR